MLAWRLPAVGTILLLAPSVAQQAVPHPETAARQRTVFAMGTALRIEIAGLTAEKTLAATEQVVRCVESVEARLSTWRADAELSRLNAAAEQRQTASVSPQLAADLRRAALWVERSSGAFDPAVGALIRSWDLRGEGRYPADAELDRALAVTGWSLLDWSHGESGGARLRSPGVSLDAGAFGKGAALDAALDRLQTEYPGARVLLDFGGQLAWSAGAAPATVAIAHPKRRDECFAVLSLPKAVRERRGSLATSANSTRARTLPDGRRIGHLLDPRTGKPARDFGSATVLAPSAFDADACSTASFVLGPDAALTMCERLPAVELIVAELDSGRTPLRTTASLTEHVTYQSPSSSRQEPPNKRPASRPSSVSPRSRRNVPPYPRILHASL